MNWNSFLALYLLVLVSSWNLKAQDERNYTFRSVFFYNVENLFDTIDNPHTHDDSHTPEGRYKWSADRYSIKLDRIARTLTDLSIKGQLVSPDIIGLCEVENRKVLEDLVQNQKMSQYKYGIIHKDSPDRRGIDVGLLYKKSAFQPISHQHHQLLIHNENEEREYTRDQLVVGGFLDNKEIYFIVNHWPSRRGGQLKSERYRVAAARLTLKILDSIQRIVPNPRILIMGDFNDNPNDHSFKNILKTNISPVKEDSQALFNPMEAMYKIGNGSLAYRDQWSLFDQIIITMNLAFSEKDEYRYWKVGIHQPEYLITSEGKYRGYPFRTHAGGVYSGGYSDHFPVYLILIREY